MVYVGIDVAKDKHDCLILNEEGSVVFNAFMIENNREGFDKLYENILSVEKDTDKIRIGLEATGHYSYNVLGYLLDKGFNPYVINPLHTNLFRKGLSLRKTKTDTVDAATIAKMLMSNLPLKPYSMALYHNQELKSLTRYRFRKVNERAKLKISISRLITILFPELEKMVSTVHSQSIYTLFGKYSSVKAITKTGVTKLTKLLSKASRGRHGKELAVKIIAAAKKSIGSDMPVQYLELQQTIRSVKFMSKDIKEIENAILEIISKLDTPITRIPGLGENMAAVIIAEIGDISNFESADKLLAFSGMLPTIYQSGQYYSNHAKMEKRGSKYLRYALFNATKHVCMYEPTFKSYLAKKRKEGKHYYVAISHAAKKLIRVIYHLMKTNEIYKLQQ